MSLFNQLSKKEIADRYTHHARYMGIPCYFNYETSELGEANGIPSFVFNVLSELDVFLFWLQSMLDPTFEPQFRIWVGPEVERA